MHPNDFCPYKRGNLQRPKEKSRWRHRQRLHWGSWVLPVATRREHGTDSPSELPEEASLPEPWFWTSGLQNWKRINFWGFPGGSVVKNPSANAGDTEDSGLIPGSGSPPGVGNGNLLQYCCLENPMDRGAWWATVRGVAKNWIWLSDYGYDIYCALESLQSSACISINIY